MALGPNGHVAPLDRFALRHAHAGLPGHQEALSAAHPTFCEVDVLLHHWQRYHWVHGDEWPYMARHVAWGCRHSGQSVGGYRCHAGHSTRGAGRCQAFSYGLAARQPSQLVEQRRDHYAGGVLTCTHKRSGTSPLGPSGLITGSLKRPSLGSQQPQLVRGSGRSGPVLGLR